MMEVDAQLIYSDEYQLLATYCKKRKRPTLCMLSKAAQTDEKFGNVAEKLTKIVGPLDERVKLTQDVKPDGDIETDGEEEDVIYQLVELMKKAGDDLNKEIQKNHKLLGYLQNTFSYKCFDKMTKTFISSVLPNNSQRSVHEEIALTCEVTSRLSALDLQPMNRVMGYGAKYLQNQFTPLVKQHGGWEKVFDDGDDDEEVH